MIINKNSWHYKLVCHFSSGWAVPDSLCPYVRALILYMLLCVVMAFGAIALVVVFIWGPIQTWLGWAGLMQLNENQYTAGIVVHGIYVMGFLSWLTKKFWIDKPTKTSPPKEPSIFMEYLKAKKQKLCPMLTFK